MTIGVATRYVGKAGAVRSLTYHLVCCPKYRRPVLSGAVAARLREPIQAVAIEVEARIHAREVTPDHVHLLVESDPRWSVAGLINRCKGCGLVIDRDVNAAKNLLKLAVSGTERVNACGAEVRPSTAGHTAMKQEGTPRSLLRGDLKQEPGAVQADKTGTVTGQLVAAGRLTHAH